MRYSAGRLDGNCGAGVWYEVEVLGNRARIETVDRGHCVQSEHAECAGDDHETAEPRPGCVSERELERRYSTTWIRSVQDCGIVGRVSLPPSMRGSRSQRGCRRPHRPTCSGSSMNGLTREQCPLVQQAVGVEHADEGTASHAEPRVQRVGTSTAVMLADDRHRGPVLRDVDRADRAVCTGMASYTHRRTSTSEYATSSRAKVSSVAAVVHDDQLDVRIVQRVGMPRAHSRMWRSSLRAGTMMVTSGVRGCAKSSSSVAPTAHRALLITSTVASTESSSEPPVSSQHADEDEVVEPRQELLEHVHRAGREPNVVPEIQRLGRRRAGPWTCRRQPVPAHVFRRAPVRPGRRPRSRPTSSSGSASMNDNGPTATGSPTRPSAPTAARRSAVGSSGCSATSRSRTAADRPDAPERVAPATRGLSRGSLCSSRRSASVASPCPKSPSVSS